MDIAPIAIFSGLVYLLTTFVRLVLPITLPKWGVMLVSAGAGIVVTMWSAAADVTANHIAFNGVPLGKLDMGSQLMFGLLSTAGAVAFDKVLAAFDNRRTSAVTSAVTSESHLDA